MDLNWEAFRVMVGELCTAIIPGVLIRTTTAKRVARRVDHRMCCMVKEEGVVTVEGIKVEGSTVVGIKVEG